MFHANSHTHLFPPASFLSTSRVPTGLNSGSRTHQKPLGITAFRAHVILCMLWHLFYDCLHIKYLNKQNGGLAAARGESHSFPCGGRQHACGSVVSVWWREGGGMLDTVKRNAPLGSNLSARRRVFFHSRPAAVAAEPSVSDCAGPGGS